MINPHIKNQRTGFHLDIQNRSSHYLKVINTRACVDNSWQKQEKSVQVINKMRKSLELPSAQHSRINSKLGHVERKSHRNSTQAKVPTLKSRYREYQKQLSIAEDNIKMLRRMEKIQSDLSKSKMKVFSKDMGRYAKIARQSGKNIEVIDEVFYRQFRRQMCQKDIRIDRPRKSHKNKIKNRLSSIVKTEV